MFFFTEKENGLNRPWTNPTYVNPPYNRMIRLWLEKVFEEENKGITSVFLLPARTDTQWFHDYVYNKPKVELRFIRGRLRFSNSTNSAPFPSMIVIFYQTIRHNLST